MVMIKRLFLVLGGMIIMGCSSVNTLQQKGVEQYWPYGGIRNIDETYSAEQWGNARYPAMAIDAPFSFTFDTVGVLCHPAVWLEFLRVWAETGFVYP